MPEIDFGAFPKTRYQGSKRKILPWIYENVKDLEFHSVLDAFGGSSMVSYMFKKMEKSVTYNDKLKFNYLIGKALIQNQNTQLFNIDVDHLYQWMNNNRGDNFIERTFGGVYYYRRENEWLDTASHGILNMNHYHGAELEYKKCIAYYALFQASIIKRPFNLFHRKNLNIRRREANVVRNFGNKTTWKTSFDEYFRRFIEEANGAVFNSRVACRSTNNSVFDINDVDYDLVYLDPPYLSKDGSNENADYTRCYHFLEGLARYQNWENLIDYNSINLRFKRGKNENDFSRENIIGAFDHLFYKFRNSKIVLSYKCGGTPSIETLKKLMENYKGHVYTVSKPYSYALNRSNSNLREVLIIGV